MEKTLIIFKPDAVQRGLVGRILSAFEDKGLKIAGMKMELLQKEKLETHYAHHRDKPFFAELLEFMSSAPCVLAILEGIDAVAVVRKMAGSTNGRKAEPGTIRGSFSMSNQNNLVHASESREIAKKEIELFFAPGEIPEYDASRRSVYSPSESKSGALP